MVKNNANVIDNQVGMQLKVVIALKAHTLCTVSMDRLSDETKIKRNNRKRKTFYDEVADIGVTVPVVFYADGFETERDFAHFWMH